MKISFRKLWKWVQTFLPLPCPWCREGDGGGRNDLCPKCRERLAFIDTSLPGCPGCGGSNCGTLALCPQCLNEPERLWLRAVALLEYRDDAGEMIRSFKFQNRPELARPLGDMLAQKVIASGIDFDLIVPVPLYWRRLWQRGYNQAALLGERIASASGRKQLHVLKRVLRRTQQAQRNRKERHSELAGSFKLIAPQKVKGRTILLVDDVLTTGATLHAAAAELLKAEPLALYVAVLARTPSWDRQ